MDLLEGLNRLWYGRCLYVRLANSKAGIKPTAPLLAFDKENSIKFPLDSVYYLYMKSNPNPSFYPMLSYESLFSYAIRIANFWARTKLTASLSVFDKENLIEFLLDLLHYIYNYYCGYAPCLPQSSCPSGDFFVTSCDCDLWLHCDVTICDCCHTFVTLWLVMWYFPCSTLVIKEKKRKRKKYK